MCSSASPVQLLGIRELAARCRRRRFQPPFSYLLFTITISVAMRYGYGPSMAMNAIFIVCD
jgi:hypothetical protein